MMFLNSLAQLVVEKNTPNWTIVRADKKENKTQLEIEVKFYICEIVLLF